MDRIRLTAVTKVTLGGRIYPPGAPLAAAAPVATALVACGAATRRDIPTHDAPSEREAPHQDLSLERVSGIGPVTARELRAAGVADLAALAALADDAVAALDVDDLAREKIAADWRAQAAALLRGDG